MPTFRNLRELWAYLKKKPEVVLEQNIGKIIEYECPVCKTVEKIKIISKDKGRCQKCSSDIKITLVIK
jgi:ribosomal protein L37AE/L43A